MTVTRTDRWVRLDGTANMRDLGGLPTSDGGRTVPGRILRSDNLQTLSADDVERLRSEFGLREVIDLRTTAEILLEGRGPLRDIPDVVHRHFSLLLERGHHTDVFAVEEDEAPLGDLSSGWVESLLPRQTAEREEGEPPAVRSYLGYLGDRPEHVVGALRTLASGEPGASIVHCAAGKDRTGVSVALVLRLLGVTHEDVMADYILTEQARGAIDARLRRDEIVSGVPRSFYLVAPEALDGVLDIWDAHPEGAEGWFLDAGGDAGKLQRLRERMIE